MIKLLVIEDHKTFISGLRYDIRSKRHGISIARAAETMDEALLVKEHEFDVILLDLILPGTDPEKNVNSLKQVFPNKPIIILTSEKRSAWEIKMKKAGVCSFYTKHDNIGMLIEGIRKVFNEGSERTSLNFELDNNVDIWTGNLKPREKEILDLIAQGKTNNQIADEIGMSVKLVYKILSRLRKKNELTNNIGLLKIFRFRL